MPLFFPDAGTKIEVCLSFLIVISSRELQEYLHFIVFYVDFTILLKHFMFHLLRLNSPALQTFTKVKNLGLKSCTKSAFQVYTAHILTQIGEMGNLSVAARGQDWGGLLKEEVDWAAVREGLQVLYC